MINECDFLVVGGGVSGLAAAMYGGRLGMKTIVFGSSSGSEMSFGGAITTTNVVENYPGFEKIGGYELAEKIKKHALVSGLIEMREEKVESVQKNGKKFKIKTGGGECLGKSILLATGAEWKKLNVPGAKEFENKGVAYCALCDAPLYKEKVVAVIGGADSGVKNALVLAEYARQVYIIEMDKQINAELFNLEKLKKNEKIKIVTDRYVTEIKGKDFVESVVLNKPFNGESEISVDGVFISIGRVALSELAKQLGVELNEKEEIIISHKTSETNIGGVFGAGDVCDKEFKQAISGVAEGCAAAYSAYKYINKNF